MEPTYIVFKLDDGEMACYGNYIDPSYEDTSQYFKVLVDDKNDDMSLCPGTFTYRLDLTDPTNPLVVEHERCVHDESPSNS